MLQKQQQMQKIQLHKAKEKERLAQQRQRDAEKLKAEKLKLKEKDKRMQQVKPGKPKSSQDILDEIEQESRPRKALTAYVLYAMEAGRKLANDRKDLKPTERLKIIGKQWSEFTDEQKQKYADKAQEGKERAEEEMAQWEKTRIKPPKKPIGSYLTFFVDIRLDLIKENPNLSHTEVVRVASEKWNTADAATKQHYVDLAAKDKERYERELEVFEKKVAKLQHARGEQQQSASS